MFVSRPTSHPHNDDPDGWNPGYGESFLGSGATGPHPFPMDIDELERERKALAETLARRRPLGFTPWPEDRAT